MTTITTREREIYEAFGTDAILGDYREYMRPDARFSVSLVRKTKDYGAAMATGAESDPLVAAALEDFRQRKLADLAAELRARDVDPDQRQAGGR